MKLEYRTEADLARDNNRWAPGALKFMGFKEDMKVFEFGPGDGWYTKALAPVLKEKGYLSVG